MDRFRKLPEKARRLSPGHSGRRTCSAVKSSCNEGRVDRTTLRNEEIW